MNILIFTVLIGVGATLLMDIWTVLRHRLFGVPALDYRLVGRWLLYLPKGTFRHSPIGSTPAVRGETWIGWTAHYLIGIAFAGIIVAVWGENWVQTPTLYPALLVGIVTVLAPFLILQPAMGAGIAASRTPKPNRARFHSLITHAVYGVGLYISGWLLAL